LLLRLTTFEVELSTPEVDISRHFMLLNRLFGH
jgi:hypothetical protein